MPLYKTGQKVRYINEEGYEPESMGIIKSVLEHPTSEGFRIVHASKCRPRYQVENEQTGQTCTVWEDNILRAE
ncbi:hypothetical protein DTO027I6_10222 [Penicillium roqueforti]|nr:hypothetical protein DTO027I6_10222 [Penicillium roqueforti]